jgi:hypothetical protein
VINNIKMGYSTTATAAGTTTLTVSSNYRQFFTGTLAQTIVLPVTSTLVTGIAYEIENNSTGLLTVNSSGGNLVGTVPAGVCAHAVCIGTTLTTAADWDWDYISTSAITGTGANVLATSPTLVTPALGTPSALVLTNATGLPAGQLTGTQTIPKATLPTGSVLQVVSATTSTNASNSTNVLADTGLTASITPSSASNKVLVIVSQNGCRKESGNALSRVFVQLQRNGTGIGDFAGSSAYTGVNEINDIGSVSASILDSPATTSAITYKTRFRNGANAAQVSVQTDSEVSTITLMEISA